MRADHDAILIGIGTALADDPELTCRLPGLEHRSPVRIVVDSRLRVPLTCRMVRGAKAVPLWVVCRDDCDRSRADVLAACGAEVVSVAPDAAGFPDPARIASALAARGLTRVLVEGGATLAASLLRAGLVDRIEWFRAASVIGGDGVPAVSPFGIDSLERMPKFHQHAVQRVGEDMLESYRLKQ